MNVDDSFIHQCAIAIFLMESCHKVHLGAYTGGNISDALYESKEISLRKVHEQLLHEPDVIVKLVFLTSS